MAEPVHAAPKSVQWRLSRLAHFCSARGIEPDDVDEAVVVAMRDEAMPRGCEGPGHDWRYIDPGMEQGGEKGAGLAAAGSRPAGAEESPVDDPVRGFPETPEGSSAWEARLLNRNPSFVDGPRRALRTTNREVRVFYLRMIASALVHKGHKIEDITSLRYLVEPAHFFQAIEYMLERYTVRPRRSTTWRWPGRPSQPTS